MQDKSHYTRYNYKKLYELAVEMFIRYGFSREDSEKVADVILTSDRFGVESHGVNRLTLYPFGIDIGRIKVDAKPEVVEDRLSMAVIDAHDGMGQLAGIQGMQLAIDKAKKYGVGMVSVRNSNHFGIAGYYSMMAAKQGLMGVSMTNAEALVVPTYPGADVRHEPHRRDHPRRPASVPHGLRNVRHDLRQDGGLCQDRP